MANLATKQNLYDRYGEVRINKLSGVAKGARGKDKRIDAALDAASAYISENLGGHSNTVLLRELTEQQSYLNLVSATEAGLDEDSQKVQERLDKIVERLSEKFRTPASSSTKPTTNAKERFFTRSEFL